MLSSTPSAAPPAGETRRCPRCEEQQPAWSFVLAGDPATKLTHRGVRRWCGFCLVKRSHIPQSRLDAARTKHEAGLRRAQIETVRTAALDLIARTTACIPPVLDLPVSQITGDRYEPVVLTDRQRQKAVDRAREHAAAAALFDAAQDDPLVARAMRTALDMLRTAARTDTEAGAA